ncbi:hypothetical protein GCM10009682_04710 [Luedemannella flava]|uniref:CYTH domain-containing protein n=1 Tax=Luedemannella flava TaxID=349316 RepID=A0ABP4XNJ2_9ACTN
MVRTYGRVERERRFLLAAAPDPASVLVTREILDRYVDGTRLRLRAMTDLATGRTDYKFTQKIPDGSLLTTMYLTADEYAVVAALPAATLRKTRHSVPPLGVDVFAGGLAGLVLAEAEFDDDASLRAFEPPAGVVAEVTDDPRFTGGRLVRAARVEVREWLAEYGVAL